MIGQIVFQEGPYVETVEQETNGVKLIECAENGTPGMFRVEWEERGHYQHSAFLDYAIAENNFTRRAAGQ